MGQLDASDVRIEVFALKQGLLSPVGHNVKLRVGALTVDVDPEEPSLKASIDVSTLKAVCAYTEAGDTPGALSAKDLTTINGYVAKDILKVSRHPTATFEATELYDNDDGTWDVEGTLTLCGVTRPLSFTAEEDGEHLRASITLNQPSFGIKPFSAMLGTLKVQPDVGVAVRLPRAALQG